MRYPLRIHKDFANGHLEASEAFSEALLDSLLRLPERKETPVWQRAEELFRKKVATLPADLQKRIEP